MKQIHRYPIIDGLGTSFGAQLGDGKSGVPFAARRSSGCRQSSLGGCRTKLLKNDEYSSTLRGVIKSPGQLPFRTAVSGHRSQVQLSVGSQPQRRNSEKVPSPMQELARPDVVRRFPASGRPLALVRVSRCSGRREVERRTTRAPGDGTSGSRRRAPLGRHRRPDRRKRPTQTARGKRLEPRAEPR
jgi:hypothetical protein